MTSITKPNGAKFPSLSSLVDSAYRSLNPNYPRCCRMDRRCPRVVSSFHVREYCGEQTAEADRVRLLVFHASTSLQVDPAAYLPSVATNRNRNSFWRRW